MFVINLRILHAFYDVLLLRIVFARSVLFWKKKKPLPMMIYCTTDLVLLAYAVYIVQYIRKVFSFVSSHVSIHD